jgi:hypothetical protein
MAVMNELLLKGLREAKQAFIGFTKKLFIFLKIKENNTISLSYLGADVSKVMNQSGIMKILLNLASRPI